MQLRNHNPNPRIFQILFQVLFLCYGLMVLDWRPEWMHYMISIWGCLLFNWIFEAVRSKSLPALKDFNRWGLSVLISAASLCLLLKTNGWHVSLFAAFFTVGSKYLFRFNKKHLFNPSAFGIAATIILTGEAWLSPSQWGSNAVIFFMVVTLGMIVVTRVQKLDISLAFLISYLLLVYWRQVLFLGWPLDHYIHSVFTGSILLFSFFMISDPKTAPDHPFARILWATMIAATAFYFTAFSWKNNMAIWVLVMAAPLVPLLDKIFTHSKFEWTGSTKQFFFPQFKLQFMRPGSKKPIAILLIVMIAAQNAAAFCGFYVSKADGTLTNKTSQVILVRDGNRNVITMFNDFKGNLKDFAMVVPVPVVLKQKDIKVVDQQIFQNLNDYSKPRLVEYFDENPCNSRDLGMLKREDRSSMSEVVVTGYLKNKISGVTVEAQYLVGEYDILILSAKESAGLKTWLDENGYKIPEGAEEVLEPYIKSKLKFFVVKVNEKEKKKLNVNFLRPIQISYTSPRFMLPIRLGMANAEGDQDMIVYAFTKTGRIETSNYRTVQIPSNKNIPLFVKDNFGNFYSNLFENFWQKEKKAIAVLEYAWDVSPKNFIKCDPCVSNPPSPYDLVQSGVWWLNRNWNDYSDIENDEEYSDDVFFTRLHIRYNRNSFPQDLLFLVTPNTESFQARYIITHPATGSFACEEGKKYLKQLKERRKEEMQMLYSLTGKGYNDWDLVNQTEGHLPFDASYASMAGYNFKSGNKDKIIWFASISLAGILFLFSIRKKPNN